MLKTHMSSLSYEPFQDKDIYPAGPLIRVKFLSIQMSVNKRGHKQVQPNQVEIRVNHM